MTSVPGSVNVAREWEKTEVEEYPGGVPPEWHVTVRRTLKEDGRYLIYYEFTPSAEAAEVELQPQEHAIGE